MTLLNQWKSEGLLTEASYKNLNLFLDLLEEWNPRINLTGLRSRTEIEEILIGESILAARVFPLTDRRILDVGSGAGIPGIVWKLYDPSIDLTSVESRAKKVAFQKEALRMLDVRATVILGLFPQAVRAARYDVITTRAVRFSDESMDQAKRLLDNDSVILRFAGANPPAEAGWRVIPTSPRSSILIYPA